jgi:hypothetical protein
LNISAIKRIKYFVEYQCKFGLEENVEKTKHVLSFCHQIAGQDYNRVAQNPAEILETLNICDRWYYRVFLVA